MSEFKCPEPGCDYHVGIGGPVVTDEDFELQDYYFQEIEEHQQMHAEQKARDAAPGGGRHPIRYRAIDLDKTHMVSTINQPFEQLYLLKPEAAVSGELVLKFHDFGSQAISFYRVLVTELEICVWRYPNGYSRELPVAGLDRVRLDQERFIFPKSFSDEILQGREGFVLNVDRMGVLPRADYELSHEISFSVGDAPDDAGVGTSESTERVYQSYGTNQEKPPAGATAEGDETKTNR